MYTLPSREHERLRSALARHELVVCLGPGVSAAAGLPARSELVRAAIAAARSLQVPASAGKLAAIEARTGGDNDPTQLLGDLEGAIGRDALEQVLSRELAAHSAGPPLPVLAALVSLAANLHLVVDTNLDRLALAAFTEVGWRGHWTIGRASAFHSRRVVKLCGDLQQKGTAWLLTARDLRSTARDHKLQGFATALFRSRVVLFVGFRGDDPLLDWLVGLTVDDGVTTVEPPLHLALVPPTVELARERTRWADRGVTLCAVGDHEDDHLTVVAQIFDQLARTCGLATSGGAVEAAATDGPYPGLEFFDETRAPHFFGREVDVDEAMTRIADDGEERRWISVEGPSGVGKSSFVRAGLVTAIRKGELGGVWAGKAWTIAVCRPGPRPFTRVVDALRSSSAAAGPDAESDTGTVLELVRPCATGERAYLLVIDQFEEALTFGDPGERARLCEALSALLREPLQLLLMTSIRSDHLPDLARLMPALGSHINTHALRHDLQPLTEAGLRDAILRPARAHGLELDPGLCQRIIADAQALDAGADETLADSIPTTRRTASRALPLVAHVLRQLWLRRHAGQITEEHYDELGGIARALTRSADDLFAGLDAVARHGADNLLLHLVVPDRGRAGFTRRTLALAEAIALAGGDERGRQVIAQLSGATLHGFGVRLIATRGAGTAAQVDVVHEALLHAWEHMAELLRRRGIERIRTDDLEREGARWADNGRSEAWLPAGLRLAELLRSEPDSATGRAYKSVLTAHEATLAAARRQRTWLRRASFGLVAATAVVLAIVSYLAVSRRTELALERDNANAQTRLAQERLDQATDLARTILADVLPRLEPHPEVRAEAKEILELLQQMLRKLGVTDSDRTVKWEILTAHQKRGDEALHTDNLERARFEYNAAIAIATELTTTAPESTRARRELARSLNLLATAETQGGSLATARDLAQQSLALREALLAADPSAPEAQRDVSLSRTKLGDIAVLEGNVQVARDLCKRNLEVTEALLKAEPDSDRAQRDFSVDLNQCSAIEVLAGDLGAARDLARRSLGIREERVARAPDSAAARQDLAATLDVLGAVEVERGEGPAAREHFLRALAIKEALVTADPHSAKAKRETFVSHVKIGDIDMLNGDNAAAAHRFRLALAVAEDLERIDPDSLRTRRDTGSVLQRLGYLAMTGGDLAMARVYFARDLGLSEALARIDPRSAQAKRDLSFSLSWLSSLEKRGGDFAAARGYLARSVEVAEQLVELDAGSAQAKRDLALALERHGDLELSAEEFIAARALFRRALALLEEVTLADADIAEAQHRRVEVLAGLGEAELELGNRTAADELLNRALTGTEALLTVNPQSSDAKKNLGQTLELLAELAAKTGDYGESQDRYERALALRVEQALSEPDSADGSFHVVLAHHEMANLAGLMGDPAARRDHLRAARTLMDAMKAKSQVKGHAQRERFDKQLDDLIAELPR